MMALYRHLKPFATIVATLLCALALHGEATAQYYSWGADPAHLKWQRIKTDDVQVIYPDTIDAVARRTLHFIDAVHGDIGYGFRYSALNIPFVMHPENMSSNGLVMWMPKRIEFINVPSVDGFSMPWVKQLVAHEYRHAVQYNNLNQKVIKGLSYVLGQQGSAVGLALLPLYIIEGDAVMCETQMSSYGRGVQPSFTMEYRALGREVLSRKNFDRWVCGSYLNHTPDYYQMGYQMTSYTYNRYNKNIWDDVVDYAVRRPYTITTTHFALKKYYGIDMTDIFHQTFSELNDFWDSIPKQENSLEVIVPIDTTNYTTYSHPIWVESRNSVVALKQDYASPSRFVEVDQSGAERKISHTGVISTRPTEADGRIWWSEYRQSVAYGEKVESKLCYMDVERGRQHTIKRMGATLYPTAMGNSRDHIAYVEYATSGIYSIVELKLRDTLEGRIRNAESFVELSRTPIAYPVEVHGLAWDDKTDELYFIATDDSGMWLGVRDRESAEGYRQLQQGAYITLSDLRAADGKLYFGSIESGYDEAHMYDIESQKEYRITTSRYGSFDPVSTSNGYLYGTTYDKHGYHLARQSSDTTQEEIEPKQLPRNVVNPERPKWDVINLDTVSYTSIDSIASHSTHTSKKYRKGLKLINVHSWMPVVFDPIDISAEQLLDNVVGATLVSQNLLSSAEGFVSAGYDFDEGFVSSAKLYYTGLGVTLGAQVNYGGYNIVYNTNGAYLTDIDRYISTTASASRSFMVREGYHKGKLSLSSSWNYSNSYVVDLDNLMYDPILEELRASYYQGLHKMAFGVGYVGWSGSAVRDFNTPLSYTLSASYTLSPTDRNFKDLVALYGQLTVPGILPHNTISLAANFQESVGGYNQYGVEALMFRSVYLLPRGFSYSDIANRSYTSTSLNYAFPIAYPNTGISSIIYFSRVRANLGFDAAQFKNSIGERQRIYSYGCDLTLDLNPLRLPSSGTIPFTLSLYRTSYGEMQFGVSMDISL